MLKNVFVKNLIIPAAVFFLFYFLRSFAAKAIFVPAVKIGRRTGNGWPQNIKDGFEKPFKLLFVFIGAFIALRSCPAFYGSGFWPVTVKCFRSFLVFDVAWGIYRMTGSKEFTDTLFAKKLDFQADSVIVPVISNVARFLIIALAILIIAQEWNYSISGLLAGLGLGGLAFALAAKDMLSNLFGGLVVLMDKPFSIGDWITTGDIEGTVEDMNFRSVKIRTFAQALVTVPNSKIVDAPVTNFSRMGKRRVSFTIGLEYGTTVEQMKDCIKKIRRMLLEDEDIDNDTIIVNFDSFGDSSMNLILQFFTVTTDWKKYLEAKEKVMFAIIGILESEKVTMAFPTQTLHIEND